jgi:hypothetical protein
MVGTSLTHLCRPYATILVDQQSRELFRMRLTDYSGLKPDAFTTGAHNSESNF